MISLLKTNIYRLGLLSGILLGLSLPTMAQEGSSNIDRAEIEKIVKEYLLNNPEILIEVQQALEQKQQIEMAATQKDYISKNEAVIKSAPYQIELGNPEAKKTIVEFFDYNCGYCQQALSDMQSIIEKEDDVRFILKEFPVLGEPSLEASQVSMAFSQIMPNKHAQFHIDLLALTGQKNGERAMELAVKMGADKADIEAKMAAPDVIQTLQKNHEIATNLGITGTPSYIIGEQVIFGAVGLDELTRQLNGEAQ